MDRHHSEQWCPTLKLLHQYPFLLPQQLVDKGAIRSEQLTLSGMQQCCVQEITQLFSIRIRDSVLRTGWIKKNII